MKADPAGPAFCLSAFRLLPQRLQHVRFWPTMVALPVSFTSSSVTSTRKVPPRTVMVQWSMPVLARNVMAVAHRPVPHDRVSPQPRSLTRMVASPASSPSLCSSMRTNSTFWSDGISGATTGLVTRSRSSTFGRLANASSSTATTCGLPMSTNVPRAEPDVPGMVTS